MDTLEVLWIVRMVLEGERVVTIGYRSMFYISTVSSQRQELSDFNAAKDQDRAAAAEFSNFPVFQFSSVSRPTSARLMHRAQKPSAANAFTELALEIFSRA